MTKHVWRLAKGLAVLVAIGGLVRILTIWDIAKYAIPAMAVMFLMTTAYFIGWFIEHG